MNPSEFHFSCLTPQAPRLLFFPTFAPAMKVHRELAGSLPEFRNAVVTIGTFDGVHKGHQQILFQLKEEATRIGGETVIITFHPHPRKIVSSVPGRCKTAQYTC